MITRSWTEIVTSISALGAWISSLFALRKVTQVRVLINSRLSQLLKITKSSSFAAGQKHEKDKHD